MPITFAYFNSPQDWLIVVGLVVLLFGGSKIPELARGVGEGIREFKKSIDGSSEPTEKKVETVETHTEKTV